VDPDVTLDSAWVEQNNIILGGRLCGLFHGPYFTNITNRIPEKGSFYAKALPKSPASFVLFSAPAAASLERAVSPHSYTTR
jgi:hypothetical protein